MAVGWEWTSLDKFLSRKEPKSAKKYVMISRELSTGRNRIFGDMFASSSPSDKVLRRESGVKRSGEKDWARGYRGGTKARGKV